MRWTVSALVALMFLGLTGCGSEAADLFAVNRSARIPGGRLALRVTDDGRASCNHAPLVEITSAQLVTARQAVRDLEKLGDRRYAPGPDHVFAYGVRTEDVRVTWTDDSARQPPVLFKLAKLARDIAKGPCRLPR